MIYAIMAILAVMAACVLFGYSLRGIVESIGKTIAPQDSSDPDCDTCKYEALKRKEEPCRTCLEDDVSMWEAR